MPKIQYEPLALGGKALLVIERANEIIEEYADQGFTLTLRQLYYQFVARDLLENTVRSYKNLGNIITKARIAGMIDWNSIEDRGRNLSTLSSWSSPAEIIETCARGFRMDPWEDQAYYPEVWVEKEALLGVVLRPCRRLRVAAFACKGYASASSMWDAGHNRFMAAIDRGKSPIIFHLGDHDPSGIDMTRDIEERVGMFSQAVVPVVRLALNMDQVERYSPPPNPAKTTDSRFREYQLAFGEESWELDALEPSTVDDLIGSALAELIDDDKWAASVSLEGQGRAKLTACYRRWYEISDFLDSTP